MPDSPLPQLHPLAGRCAIVTGASRGIGRAIVRHLAVHGVRILAAARDQAALADTIALALADRAAAGLPPDLDPASPAIIPAALDLADEASIQALYGLACTHFPRLDLLVNNAGFGTFGSILDTSTADWDRVMTVNARGAFLMSRAAFGWMHDNGGGRIINIASVVGLKGYVDQAAYASSKHAMMGLTRVMGREGQPYGIRVMAVCPGGVATDMVLQARPDLDPAGLIQPADVAHAVWFLASQPASCCTDILELRRAGSTPFA